MSKRVGLRALVAVASSVALSLGATTPARAATIVGPNYVYDNFSKVEVKAEGDFDNDPYWWVIAGGDDGPIPRNCSDAACVTGKRQGGTRFADLSLTPDATPGNYTVAEISELRTGFSYGAPTQWAPTPGHPVILNTRARFGDNYGPQGTGGAVGSAGVWLWNSPMDFMQFQFYPVDAIGFDWVESTSIMGAGLNMTVFQGTYPVYRQQVPAWVDPGDWNSYTLVWNVAGNGTQSVLFFVNAALTGMSTLPTPMGSLSVETWNDNQVPTGIDEQGAPIIEFHNPTAEQSFQMDSLALAKP